MALHIRGSHRRPSWTLRFFDPRSAIPTPQLLDSVPRFRHHRSTFRALKALDTFRVIGGRISLLSLPCPLTAPSLVCTSAIEGFGEYEYSEEAMYVARYNN